MKQAIYNGMDLKNIVEADASGARLNCDTCMSLFDYFRCDICKQEKEKDTCDARKGF